MLKDHVASDVMDPVSIIVGVSALAGLIPTVFSLVSIVWFSIQIWESDTVRGMTKRKKKDDADSK
jgi:hypothetical protein